MARTGNRLTRGRHRPLLVAVAAFVLAAPALTLTHHPVRPILPQRRAIQAALASPRVAAILASARWDHARADPVDASSERVTFFAGDRIVAEAQVSRGGQVSHGIDFSQMPVPYGSTIAYEPLLVALLALLFVLMTAVTPWRRLRNLDVAAALSLLAPVFLLRARYLDAHVLAAIPALVYLLVRCVVAAVAGGGRRRPARPLWDIAAARLDPAARLRVLRLALVALALIFLMVAVSSTNPVDVIFAVMEGATKILHGVLPYGHLPGDVVHGETYPILSYALYTPLAWLAPVTSTWDSVDIALGVGALAAVGAALAVRASVAGSAISADGARAEAGLRAALAWLAFPPLLITVSTGTTDTVVAAMLAVAVLLWRAPSLVAGLLGGAAWFKLAPAALVPIVLAPLRGRRLAAALAALLAVSAPIFALLVALGGIEGPRAMLHAVAFQFSRGSPQSLWAALDIGWLQPSAQAATLALIAGATVRVASDPELAGDRRRMAALAAAILLALEISANYWAFLYLVWVMPLVCVSVLGGSAESPAPAIAAAPSSVLIGEPAAA